MKRRLFSLLLVAAMLLSLFPVQIFAAEEGSTITVSRYNRVYVVINNTSYYINSNGVVENMDGTTAYFVPGTYTVYYGPTSGGGGGRNKTVYTGNVTVSDSDSSVSVSLSNVTFSRQSYADQLKYAESIYYNTSRFNHIHVRVEGSYVLHVNGKEFTARVSNPSMIVNVDGVQKIQHDWTNTETYEWTYSANVSRTSLVEVVLTLDLTYTDENGQSVVMEDVTVTYDNVNNLNKFIEAIAICDAVQGLDFTVTVEDVEKDLEYLSVTYEWKVYNTDGSYTTLPAGAHSAPASTSNHLAGDNYVYDTEFVTGSSFYDYNNGLLYTFHGWDTYSHSAVYNPHTDAEGYHALDDGDTDASNNSTVPITADTYIYGYWTVTELEPSSAHIQLQKNIVGLENDAQALSVAQQVWFQIDPGVDKDGDGISRVDVDYTMIQAQDGEYKIPVYQYDTPFLFTEHDYAVPGYSCETTVSITGDYIAGSTASGITASVSVNPVYTGENVHLGTVTYTNTYTKNIGAPLAEYPSLSILKTATDTGAWQAGVEFTLYRDANCTDMVAVYTTNESGLAFIDFTGLAAGTYYLKETKAVSGYVADATVYPIALTAVQSAEELRWNESTGKYEFVQVTSYSIDVTVPEGSTAVYSASRATDVYYHLHIYNEPILGSLNLHKVINGLAGDHLSALEAVVIVHGPVTRDDSGITDIGGTWTLTLNEDNNWSASVAQLPVGEYLIHESFASVHGYTWTGVTYGDLQTTVYRDITSGVFYVDSEEAIELTLTNNYEEWTAADFYIKKVSPNGTALSGATFRLYTDTACTTAASGTYTLSATTGADGYAHFDGFTVPEGQDSVTYYLKETQAPNGYYLGTAVYKVVITAVTVNGKTTYEPTITLISGDSADFNSATDLLIVTNNPVLGKLTVTKAFTNGIIPAGLSEVTVNIGGPNGLTRIVKLNAANSWSVTLSNLPLGDYTISEQNANVPGYTWSVAYSSTVVTLREETPGQTVNTAQISGTATITNTYTRNEETYENPTSLTVLKVGEDGTTPLAGAVFTLDRMDASGRNVLSSVSFTTGTEGTVTFDLLSGFLVNGDDIDGTYILSETEAPEGYEKTAATWKIVVKEDDGQIRVVLNEDKNVFENIWDWIIGAVSPGTWENGILTVQNEKKLGKLTVTKTVVDSQGFYANEVYSFTLDCSDDTFDQTFTLKAGQVYTVENIPWGTTYTLTENTVGAVFTSIITDPGNGKIWADETAVAVTNTYAYAFHNEPVSLIKVDADDTTKVIAGAGFTLYADEALENIVGTEIFSDENGRLALPVPSAGTYYLKETTAPAGYYISDTVYVVTAEEKNVVKNAGTADAVTEIQLHIRIADLTGTTENQIDYVYTIENTAIKPVTVNVEKVWYGAGVTHPSSVDVTLYRDGEIFDTVTLNAANGWKHTWTELTDKYEWSVDEPSVPSGYNKTVRVDGYSYTIINTHEDNPKTGDFNNLFGLGAAAAAGSVGFGISAFSLFARRKKEENEE